MDLTNLFLFLEGTFSNTISNSYTREHAGNQVDSFDFVSSILFSCHHFTIPYFDFFICSLNLLIWLSKSYSRAFWMAPNLSNLAVVSKLLNKQLVFWRMILFKLYSYNSLFSASLVAYFKPFICCSVSHHSASLLVHGAM